MSEKSISELLDAKDFKAPRVTPSDIQANIVSEHYFTAAQGDAKAIEDGAFVNGSLNSAAARPVPAALGLLTFCVLVLQNGFTVTGESACASPENFDAEIGRKIARKNALEKIWPLMGYELKQRLYEQAERQSTSAIDEVDTAKILNLLKVNEWPAEERNGVVHVDCSTYGWQPIHTLSEAVDFVNDNAALKPS